MARTETRLRVRRDRDEPADHLRVVFRPTRSEIHRVETLDAADRPIVGQSDWDRSLAYHFDFEQDAPDLELTLMVSFEGEPVSLASTTWYSPTGWARATAPRSRQGWAVDRREHLREAAGLSGQEGAPFTDAEIKHLKNYPDLLDTAFFTDLDLATNKGFMGADNPWPKERLDDVDKVTDVLVKRLRERRMTLFRSRRNGSLPRVPTRQQLPTADRSQLARLADLQVEFMQRFYSGSLAGVDPKALAKAFERFATGALGPCRVQKERLFEAQPDSSYFFCWAEFVFHCLDDDVGPSELWQKLLEILTTVEVFFLAAYGEHGEDCIPPTSIGKPDWIQRGPPLLPSSLAPELGDPAWRKQVCATHHAANADLQLLHAQHLATGCPGGIPNGT